MIPRAITARSVPGPITAIAHARERTRVEARRREAALEERVHAVRRREHQPVVAREIGERDVDGLDRDRRQLDDVGAEQLERGAQLACLLACACDDHRASEERPVLEPREVERGDVADDDRARRLHARVGDRRERGAHRVADRVACRCAPRRPAWTGRGRRRPVAAAISPMFPAPMRITSVPPARASASQSTSV